MTDENNEASLVDFPSTDAEVIAEKPPESPAEAPAVQVSVGQAKPRRTRRKAAEPEQIGGAISEVVDRIVEQGAEKERRQYEDPRGSHTISLTDDNAGPHMRILRSYGKQRMEIFFDEKPPQDAIDALKDHGWEWKANEKPKVWALRLERGAEWRTVQNAEKLFKDIGNTIRQENGLEPVSQLAVA